MIIYPISWIFTHCASCCDISTTHGEMNGTNLLENCLKTGGPTKLPWFTSRKIPTEFRSHPMKNPSGMRFVLPVLPGPKIVCHISVAPCWGVTISLESYMQQAKVRGFREIGFDGIQPIISNYDWKIKIC